MKRWLMEHELNLPNCTLEIAALDEPSGGGACHEYEIGWLNAIPPLATIKFQKGPVLAGQPNGVSNEALIAIVLDRLRGFQGAGPPDSGGNFPCRENDLAITKLEEGLMWLHKRTRDRVEREVEGTRKK